MLISRRFLPPLRLLALTLGVWFLAHSSLLAQNGGGVQAVTVKGTLLARGGGGWQTLQANASIAPGTTLVSLFEADLKCTSGAVSIKMLGDIGQFGPLPVLDTAMRVLDHGMADAALALDRGLVILTNTKEQGAATVLVKMRGEDVQITLKTPGTKVGIELYGRHPGGAVHILKDDPTTFVYILVGHGEAVVSSKANTHAMTAPPGSALLRWDSVTKQAEVVGLEEFPEELVRNEQEKQQFEKMCAAARAFHGKTPTTVAAAMVKSDDALERRVAVTAMGAVDDVPHLLAALGDAQHKDVREQAILVLRSWLGRTPGQMKMLVVPMLKQKYTLPQRKTIMHLLVGFDEQERDRPVIYELLLSMLDHKSVAVRELAHWHLVRMAPAGRDIVFDAGAAEEDRQKAVERWRKLIPPGELPPRPKLLKK